jgi:hypothetical protein
MQSEQQLFAIVEVAVALRMRDAEVSMTYFALVCQQSAGWSDLPITSPPAAGQVRSGGQQQCATLKATRCTFCTIAGSASNSPRLAHLAPQHCHSCTHTVPRARLHRDAWPCGRQRFCCVQRGWASLARALCSPICRAGRTAAPSCHGGSCANTASKGAHSRPSRRAYI